MKNIIGKIIERLKYGYKIGDDCYISGGSRHEMIIRYKDRKLGLMIEASPGKPSLIFYLRRHEKWLPPHENDTLSEEQYQFIVNLVVRHFQRKGKDVAVKMMGSVK